MQQSFEYGPITEADLDAEIARRYDPQIAAIYYDQMMRKGKHHKQAVCLLHNPQESRRSLCRCMHLRQCSSRGNLNTRH